MFPIILVNGKKDRDAVSHIVKQYWSEFEIKTIKEKSYHGIISFFETHKCRPIFILMARQDLNVFFDKGGFCEFLRVLRSRYRNIKLVLINKNRIRNSRQRELFNALEKSMKYYNNVVEIHKEKRIVKIDNAISEIDMCGQNNSKLKDNSKLKEMIMHIEDFFVANRFHSFMVNGAILVFKDYDKWIFLDEKFNIVRFDDSDLANRINVIVRDSRGIVRDEMKVVNRMNDFMHWFYEYNDNIISILKSKIQEDECIQVDFVFGERGHYQENNKFNSQSRNQITPEFMDWFDKVYNEYQKEVYKKIIVNNNDMLDWNISYSKRLIRDSILNYNIKEVIVPFSLGKDSLASLLLTKEVVNELRNEGKVIDLYAVIVITSRDFLINRVYEKYLYTKPIFRGIKLIKTTADFTRLRRKDFESRVCTGIKIERLYSLIADMNRMNGLKNNLKENKLIVLGNRAGESIIRRKKGFLWRENIFGQDMIFLAPIFLWNYFLLQYYIEVVHGLMLNPLYYLGFYRTGCRYCPFATKTETQMMNFVR